MTDHPACYDFVKEATECRCSSRGAQNKVVLPRKIVRSRYCGTLNAGEGEFALKLFPRNGIRPCDSRSLKAGRRPEGISRTNLEQGAGFAKQVRPSCTARRVLSERDECLSGRARWIF